jgi:hypothetical protein
MQAVRRQQAYTPHFEEYTKRRELEKVAELEKAATAIESSMSAIESLLEVTSSLEAAVAGGRDGLQEFSEGGSVSTRLVLKPTYSFKTRYKLRMIEVFGWCRGSQLYQDDVSFLYRDFTHHPGTSCSAGRRMIPARRRNSGYYV